MSPEFPQLPTLKKENFRAGEGGSVLRTTDGESLERVVTGFGPVFGFICDRIETAGLGVDPGLLDILASDFSQMGGDHTSEIGWISDSGGLVLFEEVKFDGGKVVSRTVDWGNGGAEIEVARLATEEAGGSIKMIFGYNEKRGEVTVVIPADISEK